MRAPQVVAALALAPVLAAGAAPGENLQLQLQTSPPPDEAPRIDVRGHLLAAPDRELLQVGRVRLELRAAGGSAGVAEPFGPPDPAPHAIQTFFNMDAQSVNLLVRFPLAPAGSRAPAPPLP